MRTQPCNAAVYGIDLGKNSFHVVGTDRDGQILQRFTLTRTTLDAFFQLAKPAVIGVEACPGSQWIARRLSQFGHVVKIIPAQFVKPYVKSNKNDTIDAAAIAEAVTRPTMRFVQVKSTEQIELQTLHRIRERMVASRTQLINQMRGFCLEFGIAIRVGITAFRMEISGVLGDESNDLTPRMRHTLFSIKAEFNELEARIDLVTEEINDIAKLSDVATRLTTIPGIGHLAATALIAAVGDGKQFSKARDMAAWLGLVPAQYSTGGKTTLKGISKRGNPYVRRMLIHGARACSAQGAKSRHGLGQWVQQLSQRMHFNKVVVALANKIARIAWTILRSSDGIYRQRAVVVTP